MLTIKTPTFARDLIFQVMAIRKIKYSWNLQFHIESNIKLSNAQNQLPPKKKYF